MEGLMMRDALSIPAIIDHAARTFPDQEVISVGSDGAREAATYREVHDRSRRLASALLELGVSPGDRLATLAWNTQRHLEIYYGVPGVGAIVHTLNPRLTPEMLSFIVGHAQDSVLFFEPEFAPLARSLASLGTVRHFVMLGEQSQVDAADWPGLLSYDQLVASAEPIENWLPVDEDMASGLCYTSGTTGNPKGVLYSHRSTVLHALVASLQTNLNLGERDCVLPIVPMFHVNAWGLPHIGPLVGARLVMPRNRLDGASLAALLREEKVTFAAGVPTIFQGLAQHLSENGGNLPDLRNLVVGGAALPAPLYDFFKDRMNITMTQGWGMTETSPLCTYGRLGPQWDGADPAQVREMHLKQGRTLFGLSTRIASADDRDNTPGELLVRGPWIARRYFAEPSTQDRDWLPTGDICEFDDLGYMKITDRAKDLIKSGGEWISSSDLEEKAYRVDGVAQAAAIAVPDAKWGERPLLVVVGRKDAQLDIAEIRDAVSDGLASWQIPDRIEFIDQMPLGPTGKILKSVLRARFAGEKP